MRKNQKQCPLVLRSEPGRGCSGPIVCVQTPRGPVCVSAWGCEPVPQDPAGAPFPVPSRGVALHYSQVREKGWEGLLDGEFKHRKTAEGTQFEESIRETCLENWGNLKTAVAMLSPDCCSNLQAQDWSSHTPSSRQSAHCRLTPQAQSARAPSLMSVLCYCSS